MNSSNDSLELIDEALGALHTSLAARAVYWAEHAAATAHLKHASELLDHYFAREERASIMFLADRVVVSGREPASSVKLAASLGKHVREHGIECITLSRGLQIDELGRLLDTLAARPKGADETLPSFAHVKLENVSVDQRGPRHSSEAASKVHTDGSRTTLPALTDTDAGRQSVSGLTSLWAEGLCPTGPAGQRIEMAVSSVLGLLASCRGGVVPLAALKSHDEYTYVHASNVAVLAGALAETLGMEPAVVRDITVGALLHDVGKERIPRTVLNKNGKLDDRELAIVRQHPVDGARMLAGADGVPDLAIVIAYEHHMHLDNTGYPRIAPGRSIHLASRIVQLADVYDALGTHRPYRAALSPHEICRIMAQRSGTAYDSALFTVFADSVIGRTEKPASQIESVPANRAAA